MHRAVALAMILGLSGCVTGAGVWKRDQVSLPMLAGAVAADLVVTTVVASQVQDFTIGASLGTAAAVTAVDVAIGCLIGSCHSLRL
ncbi:MAG TPA: hypothetical protein VFS15_02170 [Kofleriaceae bacterium]|nr:hypothetical protein [Kofleriaceae bacterium]